MKSNTLYIFLLVFLLGLFVLLDYLSPKQFDWSKNYRANFSEPYDYQVFNELVNKSFDKEKLLAIYPENEFPENTGAYNYIRTAQGWGSIDSSEYKWWMRGVYEGGKAFLILREWSVANFEDLTNGYQDEDYSEEEAYVEEEYEEEANEGAYIIVEEYINWDSTYLNEKGDSVFVYKKKEGADHSLADDVYVNEQGDSMFVYIKENHEKEIFGVEGNSISSLKDEKTVDEYIRDFDITFDYFGEYESVDLVYTKNNQKMTSRIGDISYFIGEVYGCTDTMNCSINYLVVEKKSKKPVLIALNFGKGKLYVCSQPELFSNYYLLYKDSYVVLNDVLEEMASAPTYIKKTKIAKEVTDSPFQFINKNPTLKWGIRWAMAMLLLYLMFMPRRRQRAVPEIKPLPNLSKDFAETVGDLYFEYKDHADLAKKQSLYLLEDIRANYKVRAKRKSPEFAEELAIQLNLDKKEGQELATKLNEGLDGLLSDESDLVYLERLNQELNGKQKTHKKNQL